MKRKLIYIHIAFLIIIALILSIFYKNYSVIKMRYINAFNDIKVTAFNEIAEVAYCTKYIIDNFDKDGFSMENISYLELKVKFVFLAIDALMFARIDSFEIDNYGTKLISMYNTFSLFDRFLTKVIEHIKDGGKPFNLFDNNDNMFLIKTKKDIYNEFLFYHDLFSKLDLHVTKSSTGTELFNKIIKTWDIEKANKIVYPSERN